MRTSLFRVLTGFIGIYHLALGLSALLLPTGAFTRISNWILGFNPPDGPVFKLMASFTAAYVLSFGVMMVLLAIHPLKFRALVIPAMALFGVRLINKILLFGTIGEQFDVSQGRNIFGVACIAILLLGLILLQPKKEDSPSSP